MRKWHQSCLALLALIPCAVFAAQGAADPYSLAAFFAAGVAVIAITILVYLVFFGLFIHIATRIVGLRRPFSFAVRALLLGMLLNFLFGLIGSFFHIPGMMVAHWAAATFAIMSAYQCGFFQAFMAALLSMILTFTGVVVTMLLLFTYVLTSTPRA